MAAVMGTVPPSSAGLIRAAARIGAEIAAVVAADVDARARFPHEALEALRNEGLLAAFVPVRFGGAGCTVADLSAMCIELGRHCSSSALVFAMHQIQVACLVDAVGAPYFDELLREIAASGRLFASATTEAGVGGDVRSSICAVERDGTSFRLHKHATVISYGAYADDVLVTARREVDAAPSDQVLVHVRREDWSLSAIAGEWDTLGMRGTCSVGFDLQATGTVDQILPDPFQEISARTMLPVTHITWASVWLGIAEHAVRTARTFVRSTARKQPGTLPPAARRLAVLVGRLDRVRALVESCVREFDGLHATSPSAVSMAFTIRMNNLKLCVSTDVMEIVQSSLEICGLAGYRNDTEFSLGRQLRDAQSAPLMVHNDRILEHNAALLCVLKD